MHSSLVGRPLWFHRAGARWAQCAPWPFASEDARAGRCAGPVGPSSPPFQMHSPPALRIEAQSVGP
eukprot:8348583-Alexandrium_andersonii.AAC.1